ncbi:hypothetical protein B0H14DRAFT_2664508 [Mycena olivaceomarginata]|nr:hypothetical protein B0H14DRAFT_2664508 [Mycena olivaceomarginata]
MSHNAAMTNVQPRVVDSLAEDPDSFVLFIPFLGGTHFNKKYRDAASDLTKYLEEITSAGGTEIYPPTPHEKGDFAGHCHSKEVHDELSSSPALGIWRSMFSRSTSCACCGCWATGVATRWYRSPRWCCAPPSPPPLSPRARSAPPSCTSLGTRRARQTSVYTAQLSRHYGLCMGSRAASHSPSGNLSATSPGTPASLRASPTSRPLARLRAAPAAPPVA